VSVTILYREIGIEAKCMCWFIIYVYV